MNEVFYVYVVTDDKKQFCYLGITNQLARRVKEHRFGAFLKADEKTRFTTLVYYEEYDNLKDALLREERLLNLKQSEREAIINGANPDWHDLTDSIE